VKDRKEIISVSLEPDQVRELERLRTSGAAARSQVVRAALREHFARLRSEPDGPGMQDVVILCLYHHADRDGVLARLQGSDGAIKTMVHSHGGEGLCLDMCHMEVAGSRLRELLHTLRGLDGVRSVQVVALPRPPDGPSQP
jgi:metal-responsive CopG/Arc/MetJ family transcriptional regulator